MTYEPARGLYVRASHVARVTGLDTRTIRAWIQCGAIEGHVVTRPNRGATKGIKSWYVTRDAYNTLVSKYRPNSE